MKDNAEMTKEELIALGWVKNPLDKMQEKTEKQLTAVEWLYNHLFPKQLDGFSDEEWNKIDLAFKQAKEMEKEQMEITWNNAIDALLKDKWDSYDDFHNTTFKSE